MIEKDENGLMSCHLSPKKTRCSMDFGSRALTSGREEKSGTRSVQKDLQHFLRLPSIIRLCAG